MTWILNIPIISIITLFIQLLYPINATRNGITRKYTFSRRLFGIVHDNKIQINSCIINNDYYNEQQQEQQLIPKSTTIQTHCIQQQQYQPLLNINENDANSIVSIFSLSVRGGSGNNDNIDEEDNDTGDDEEYDDNEDSNESESEAVKQVFTKTKTIRTTNDIQHGIDNNIDTDCTILLANSYNVPATRQEYIIKKIKKSKKKKKKIHTTILPILNGSFTDALQIARTNGRLLLIVIPTTTSQESKASDITKTTADQIVMESFLSTEVTKLIESNVNKHKKNNNKESPVVEQKSFVLWYTKPNSIDATIVLKQVTGIQIKNPKTNKKRPILAVIYPSRVVAAASNTIVPQLIGQYHCNPVPTIETLIAWLQSIRVRSKKQQYYKNMYNEIIENVYYQQRIDGYKGSITNDIQRIENEKIQQKQAKELALQQRLHTQKIIKRRQQLKDILPIEPIVSNSKSSTTTNDITTIALRFVDSSIVSKSTTTPTGTTGSTNTKKDTRRFNTETTTLTDIFNWIDVQYEIEREYIILQSMKQNDNNKQYTWITNSNSNSNSNSSNSNHVDDQNENNNNKQDDDTIMSKTLSELGFGKMIAFRVSILQKQEQPFSSLE